MRGSFPVPVGASAKSTWLLVNAACTAVAMVNWLGRCSYPAIIESRTPPGRR